MTHGEELSSEMQQDPIVLTYLEGLLMHQAAGGSGTAVDKHSVGRATVDENFKTSGNIYSNSQNNAPAHSNSPCQGSGMLHLKKARLLQSSEDWNAAKRRRLSDTVVAINGKNEALLAGMAENVPKGKQDSTLLASLLQSFSSRLQSVALSQQIKQSLKDQGFSITQDAAREEKDNRCYGVASSHLKTILNKSKSKDKTSDNNLTGLAQHEKFAEPSLSGQSISKAASEPVSCAARLQAVASMVEKRSSPTSSPKPSIACSQLALLLSSEAHLQQYSREHALKAQSASQLASERLAAMARLKESSENNMSRFKFSANLPASHNSPSRPLSNGISNVGNISPFPNQLGIPHSPHKPVVYKNHTERNHVKPSPNSSLLLHLLKSHNATGVSTSHVQGENYSMFEESATPTTTDDFSDNNPSFTEEESSDDESTHSNCAPIDLSFKNRVDKPETIQTASIDNLTESLLHNWDPKVNGLDIGRDHKDTSADSTLKPYQKVTLLQLLLGHKVDENPQSVVDLRGPQKAADVSKFSLPAHNHLSENTSIGNSSPLNNLPLHGPSKADVPVNLSQQPFQIKPSFTSYLNKIQSETLTNPASKHLIELTRNKTFQPPVPLTNENAPNNAFSASKLLQNLAQCGMPTPEEQLPKQLNVSNGKTVGLVDRLRCPLVINQSNSFDEGKTFTSPPTPVDSGLPSSEIENLLERRTVLQLLLGAPNKSKNDRVQKTVIKNESPQDHDENIPSEQIVTLKIKTEPEDDSSTHHFRDLRVLSPHDVSVHKTARSTPEDTKPQQLSPHDFSGTRNGLLSRLLRQNHDGYDTNDLGISRHCESKLTESKIHCVLPKKRKMPQHEPVESQVKIAKLSSPDRGSHQLVGPRFLQEEINGGKADHETRCTVGQSSFNEKSVCWSRESKGFNVLKQLLLSENCVRDLSQHRNHTVDEEELKGSRNNLAGSSDVVPSLNVLMGKHSHANNLGQMTFQYQSSLRRSPHTPPEVSGNKMALINSGHLNMCPVPNDKGPIKWVIAGMEKNEFGKDSPRLTKTNPILYYMLQKGAHSAGSQDFRDRNSWSESLLGKSNEMTLKKEPIHSRLTHTNGIGLMKPSSHSVNKTIHNSSGEKCGRFDMISIKKEPE
ncbi:nuclear receptor-interacting protein 1 [Spea bombifrons]|uniref:nuclear receptor-interacting protein 1 n=1 Tax=Spea bombifrons TaxID=233779 RepID=UPI00234AA396|nr:nuclear receptor-interacting protein 1 [Spea bombifrons]